MQQYFTKTKKQLFELIDELNESYKQFYEKNDKIWYKPLSNDDKNVHDYFSEICMVNQVILNTLKKTKKEIYQGKLNNKHSYYESDFTVVEVVHKIYTEFSNKKILIPNSEIQDLKQILILQMESLFNEIETFPDDFACNVISSPGIITTIRLDYYQLIYLALLHAQHHIMNIKMNKAIQMAMHVKVPRTRVY